MSRPGRGRWRGETVVDGQTAGRLRSTGHRVDRATPCRPRPGLQTVGEFHADGRRVPRTVRPVFGWMRRQMIERLDGASGHPLIWLTVAPDMERRGLCDWRCTRRQGALCSKVHIRQARTGSGFRSPRPGSCSPTSRS